MPSSRPVDQSLLDRLNALKPTAVTLGRPADAATPSGPGAQPVSREDALAERLRTLRDQSGSRSRNESHSQGGNRLGPGIPNGGEAGKPASPSVEPPIEGRLASKENAVSLATSVSQEGSNNADQKPSSYRFVGSDVDDDEALDELLEALGDEDFVLAAEDDMELPPGFDPRGEADRVNRLLESLQNKGPEDPTSRGGNIPAEDDDDSDGEQMTRAVEGLLSQIGDEINALPPLAGAPSEDNNRLFWEADAQPGAEPAAEPAKGDDDDGGPSLALPAVPSQLVDPVPSTKPEDDFEKDISARLASLRGLGAVDELGLPSAPTFRPQDHDSDTVFGKGLLRSSKYTDEDQKTWCIVCLDDATIRCVGCDNDVYCARCWKDMHVGPSAGYNERGHQWVKFERTARP